MIKCKRCNVDMEHGKAFQNTLNPGCRMPEGSVQGGPAQMVDCFKCPKCGHSVEAVSDKIMDDHLRDSLRQNVLDFEREYARIAYSC